ncbi:MAG: nicotinate-nucleotide adenylyltransferase [Muribaculaceae bacterium]|nr:nicotinate-nucleotide adenylyltransferase [Muribaculaceae bacterium]
MNLCVFQGTFNPIHKAHLNLAEFVLKTYQPDKLIFIPAANPPHKSYNPEYSRHRYNMVKLAIETNPAFLISDIEYQRGGKSYTYLTICELRKIYNINERILFIIGTDAFEKIESWYEFDKLKDLVKFIVFVREDNFDITRYDYLKERGVVFEFQPLPYTDISSTELRQRIKDKKDISSFVTKNVEEYIRKNGLYQD